MSYVARTSRPSARLLARVPLAILISLAVTLLAGVAHLNAQAPSGLFDLGRSRVADEQHAAEDELEQARQAVAQARDAAAAAKAQLEQAAASPHSDLPADDAASTEAADESSSAQGREPPARASTAYTAEEIDQVVKRIRELRAQRGELLAQRTAAHPLVIDVDSRLEEYTRRLAEMTDGAPDAESPLETNRPETIAPPLPSQEAQAAKRLEEATARMQEALAGWQSAEQSLQAAIEAELAAAEKLATIGARAAAQVASEEEPSPPAATDVTKATVSDGEPRRSSEPLIIAALLIALVIAAVASIKLARASDETMFAGADDAASTLALPVIGVIPAMTIGSRRGVLTQRFRGVVLVCQLLLAVAIFAVVAYLVQNPGLLWQLCTDPAAALSGQR